MVESTSLFVPLLLVALASSASLPLRPSQPGVMAEATTKRLTVTATPSAYAITLNPDLEAQTFTGSVAITATVSVDGTTQVMFHADNSTLKILSGKVTLPEKAEQTLTFEQVANTTDMFTASWDNATTKDAVITLTIEYSGTITTDMDGFYISTYKVNDVDMKLASTQFEATSARKAFPCLDEPHLKATFTMTITAPDGYGVLFNTESKSTKPNVYTFEPTPIMSTYLVAFVIYDKETFTNLTNKDAAKQQAVWSREEMSSQRQLALDAGSQCLDKYSAMFGIDYFNVMMKKMDQIAIPDFSAGAMENWGLVTYRESELLGEADKISISDTRNIIETVAHEFAHQWFGDIVSPDYWNVLWLNEGFATYWMYHVPIDLYKGYNMENAFVAIDMEVALEADAYDTTHPMTVPLNADQGSEVYFDAITYQKAGSVIRMMKHIVGEKFETGLSNYLKANNFSTAKPEDLYDNLAPGDSTFKEAMLSWSDTTGYPVVMVTRNYDNDNFTAIISQMPYLMNKDTTTDPTWITPITYTNNLTETTSEWLRGNDTLQIEGLDPGSPLIVNLQRQGFYRVNYDVANWELIASLLQRNVSAVDEVTRAALVSDAFAMARSGDLNYTTALDLSTYLLNEVNYVPWEAAFRHLSFLDTCFASSTAYDQFKKYMVSLVTKSYDKVTFDFTDGDTAETRLHRENIVRWSCKIGLPDCSDKAKAALSNNEAKPHPDVRGVVYCEGVRTDDSQWDELQGQLVNSSTSATEKLVIMKALGCSEKIERLQQLLTMARNASEVRPQDIASAYAAVYNNPLGVTLVLDDIGKNTEELINQFSGLQKILKGLGDKITTNAQLDKLKKLDSNAQVKDMPAYKAALNKAQEQVDWLSKNEKTITDWLTMYNSAISASASTLLLAVAALFTFLNH